jgi:hypothetical protein
MPVQNDRFVLRDHLAKIFHLLQPTGVLVQRVPGSSPHDCRPA